LDQPVLGEAGASVSVTRISQRIPARDKFSVNLSSRDHRSSFRRAVCAEIVSGVAYHCHPSPTASEDAAKTRCVVFVQSLVPALLSHRRLSEDLPKRLSPRSPLMWSTVTDGQLPVTRVKATLCACKLKASSLNISLNLR
jgi:hypothetical protein